MPTPPLISIGMSVRNNAASLPLTLRSLLRQTFTDWELILIDDGSSDDTVLIARRFADPRIRLITEAGSRGLAYRLNQALVLARGRYFARLDGDDVCFPQRFACQVDYLEQHPEVDLLGTGGIVFSGEGNPLGLRPAPSRHEEICRRPWSGFHLAHPSWMGRIEWFRRYGYDERAMKAQDYDLLLRAHATSRFAALAEPLIGYREDLLDVRKNLASRRQTVMAQWRYARATKQWRKLSFGVLAQVLKGIVELAVIGTPLERRMLGHRATPLDAASARDWQVLWMELMHENTERCVD